MFRKIKSAHLPHGKAQTIAQALRFQNFDNVPVLHGPKVGVFLVDADRNGHRFLAVVGQGEIFAEGVDGEADPVAREFRHDVNGFPVSIYGWAER